MKPLCVEFIKNRKYILYRNDEGCIEAYFTHVKQNEIGRIVSTEKNIEDFKNKHLTPRKKKKKIEKDNQLSILDAIDNMSHKTL